MINGIMKLFYTEVVKSKISKLPNEQYEINSKFKKVQEISAKIDTILLYTLKILVAVATLLFSYKINIYFGIGMCLVEISYLFYKKSLISYFLLVNLFVFTYTKFFIIKFNISKIAI